MTVLSDLTDAARTALASAGPATVAIGRHGRGAGLVVAPNRVLTNAHNLRDRTTQVTFADGRVDQGRLVGTDADHDVVVLEVDTGDIAPPAWADDEPGIGEAVFAVVQSPWGDRVTPGFVSGRGRAFRGPRGRRIKGGVEHTAPLARGSSGSPLVDATGRIVAINTHRLGDGFYLALPADAELRARVDGLAKGDDVRGKRLGISVVPGPAAARLRAKVGLPDQAGLLVAGVVPGSPADAAGVSEGDLVVAVDGHETPNVDALWDVLDDAGDTVVLRLVRGTDEREVTLSFAAAGGGAGDDDAPRPTGG